MKITEKRRVRALLLRMRLRGFVLATRRFKNPIRAMRSMLRLRNKRREYFGAIDLTKMIYNEGRYFWTLEAPGWPGESYDRMISNEILRFSEEKIDTSTLRLSFLSVTKKCPLSCEHCYDWHNLNKKEGLTLEQLEAILCQLQDKGVSQVFFSGGEPLVRFDDLLALLASAKKGTDFWVLTSGFHLDRKKAMALKRAGLTGACISLDHYEAASHNQFRGLKNAYEMALDAVGHAKEAGLVTALSICPGRDFVTEENLMQYAQLARRLGVAFIQVLEPRAVGRYEDADVALTEEQLKILDAFYLQMNFDASFLDWPIVSYHGYRQRRIGCGGAGDRFLYIDGNGDMHACPFCQTGCGNVLTNDWDDSVDALRKKGCEVFEPAKM